MKKYLSTFLFSIAFVYAFGQYTIPFQGKLLEDGEPVTGVRSFTFSIGDVSWTETQPLQVSNGLYSTRLGSTTPLPELFKDVDSHQLGISIDGNALSEVTLYPPYIDQSLTKTTFEGTSTSGQTEFEIAVLGTTSGEGSTVHYGLRGEAAGGSNSTGNIGVRGIGTGTAKYQHGLLASSTGAGNGDTGDNFGEGSINFGVEVFASGNNWNNTGIEARGFGTVGDRFSGVSGFATGGDETTDRNVGVQGFASGPGVNYGVYGSANSGVENWAGYFEGDVNISGNLTVNGSLIGSTDFSVTYDPADAQPLPP